MLKRQYCKNDCVTFVPTRNPIHKQNLKCNLNTNIKANSFMSSIQSKNVLKQQQHARKLCLPLNKNMSNISGENKLKYCV